MRAETEKRARKIVRGRSQPLDYESTCEELTVDGDEGEILWDRGGYSTK